MSRCTAGTAGGAAPYFCVSWEGEVRPSTVSIILSFILVYKVSEAKNSISFNVLEDGDLHRFHVA